MLREGGFSLVETIVALGLLALVAAGLVQLNFTFRSNVGSTSLGVRANALAAETVEAVRALRDENWSNLDGLTPRADYYLSFSEGLKKWSAVSLNPGKVEAVFTRSFRVFPVYRDSAGGNIVSSGGVLDAETLRVEVIVSWIDRGTLKDQRLISYLSNF
ncbi:MAG: prepilin-type N-terminal cleavage/methylation domain-containing protein [Parcubacteria group bacterium]|nr:prepilin-type N-terminal cleavage/methylation domain-containing protein [Parcubacteria group bacterium]